METAQLVYRPRFMMLVSILSQPRSMSERIAFVERSRTIFMALAVKSADLGGLKKAMFVLQCLDRGQTRQQIVELLNSDGELVDVWISFLMQYDWIEQENESDEWSVTSKGREWYEEISRNIV